MFRTGSRQLLRQTALPIRAAQRTGGIRHQSTKVPRRSVKNGLARWAIAIGGTYWYMTSPLFNEKPGYTIQQGDDSSEAKLQTIDSVKPSSRLKPPHPEDTPIVASSPTSISPPSINPKSEDPAPPTDGDLAASPPGGDADGMGVESLEQEAASQGAFNEETGEINWDCPCLGGMAHGPCGEQFRDAFSCFVYSKEEPKGMDCIDKFERMQGCFREHPEIYADEIADDERISDELAADQQDGKAGAAAKKADGPDVDEPSVWTPMPHQEEKQANTTPAQEDTAKPAQGQETAAKA